MSCKPSSPSSDWANTPKDVLHAILDRLSLPWFCEYARFACVCKPWLAADDENYRQFQQTYNLQGNRLPILMVPSRDDDDIAKRDSYYMMKKKDGNKPCKNLHFSVVLPPDSVGADGCSPNGGWIATWNRATVVTILNPFVNNWAIIRLPPLDKHHNAPCVHKVIAMSSSSSSTADGMENYIVAAICGPDRRLAFIKSGDKDWNRVTDSFPGNIGDVIFHKGRILAVGIFDPLYAVDVDAAKDRNTIKRIGSLSKNQKESYLAESPGGDDVLIFARFYKYEIVFPPPTREYTTTGFKIYRLSGDHIASGEYDRCLFWDESWSSCNLGDDAAFLGDNYWACVEAAGRWMPNCIYYTDVDDETYDIRGEYRAPRVRDLGVFHVKDGSIEQHYKADDDAALKKEKARPFWVLVALPRFN